MSGIGRALGAFGRFWWEFLVGETPELFVGALAVVAAAFALHDHPVAAAVAVPLVAVGFLLASVWRGRLRG